MSNAVATRPGSAVANPNYDPFAAAAEGLGGSFATYMKFSGNEGTYSIGKDDAKQDIPLGTKMACDMPRAMHGWLCFVESKVVEEVEILIASGEPLPVEEDLNDHGPYTKYADGTSDGWKRQFKLPLFSLADGAEYELNLMSGSGLSACGSLLKDFARQYKMKPGMIPVIELNSKGFEAFQRDAEGNKTKKTLGMKFAPTLRIVDWVAADQFTPGSTGEADNPENYDEEVAAIEDQTAAPTPPPVVEKPAAPVRQRAVAEPVKPAVVEKPAAVETPAADAAPKNRRGRSF